MVVNGVCVSGLRCKHTQRDWFNGSNIQISILSPAKPVIKFNFNIINIAILGNTTKNQVLIAM